MSMAMLQPYVEEVQGQEAIPNSGEVLAQAGWSAISNLATDVTDALRVRPGSSLSRRRRLSTVTIRPATTEVKVWATEQGWKEKGEKGQSSFSQALCNALCEMLGAVLLSASLAFSYAGWLGGFALLIFVSLVTNRALKVMARIMFSDARLQTYTDVTKKAFGARVNMFVSVVFACELFAWGIAKVILFADSLNWLVPQLSITFCKLLAFLLSLPTVLLPLRYLSFTSTLSILCMIFTLLSIFVLGFMNPHSPGSLRDPAPTSLLFHPDVPNGWVKIPVSWGLIMAAFGGASVLPTVARDMREPERFEELVDWVWLAVAMVYALLGTAGYLMFGFNVRDEITKNFAATPNLNKGIVLFSLWCVAINPLVKIALGLRPLSNIFERWVDLEPSAPPAFPSNRRSRAMSEAFMDGTYRVDPSALREGSSTLETPSERTPLLSSSNALEGSTPTTATPIGIAQDLPSEDVDFSKQQDPEASSGSQRPKSAFSMKGLITRFARSPNSNTSTAGSSTPPGSLLLPLAVPLPVLSQRRATWWAKEIRKAGLVLLTRVLLLFLVVVVAIIFPDFEQILGLLGTFTGALICVIFPLGAGLRVHWKDYKVAEGEADEETGARAREESDDDNAIATDTETEADDSPSVSNSRTAFSDDGSRIGSPERDRSPDTYRRFRSKRRSPRTSISRSSTHTHDSGSLRRGRSPFHQFYRTPWVAHVRNRRPSALSGVSEVDSDPLNGNAGTNRFTAGNSAIGALAEKLIPNKKPFNKTLRWYVLTVLDHTLLSVTFVLAVIGIVGIFSGW